MTLDDAKLIHGLIADDDWVGAGNAVLKLLRREPTCSTPAQAIGLCQKLLQHTLDSEAYLHAATLEWGPSVFLAEPQSVRHSFDVMRDNSLILMMGASSMGKCVKFDQPIIKHDGTTVRANQIRVSDVLMGDDGGPRTVLAVNPGRGPMYRITPERGEPWECNGAHILSLRVSSNKRCGSGCWSKKWKKGDVIDISVQEYLALSRDKKNRLKQFHVGVEMPHREVPFDAYVVGAWLGDGTMTAPTLNTPDGPMAQEWRRYFTSLGYTTTEGGVAGQMCRRYNATTAGSGVNSFRRFLASIVVDSEKRIPEKYLINSRSVRSKLLAGLIDSDGWVHQKTGYGFVSKYETLARQVVWLCRSLGLCARINKRNKRISSIGFVGEYWMVSISGQGITTIPTLEKRANEPSNARVLTNTSFKVEPIGDGDWFGLVIDGNHRFLLGDFTVTHNSYGIGAWMVLDYLRDPLYTAVKLAAVSEKHLRENLYPHVVKLIKGCAIPCPYEISFRESDLWLGIKEAGYEFGISGIAFKQSQETSGQFKGYKFVPVRKKPHPKFGYFSRLRVLGDEGQNWPGGPFQDFHSLTASLTGLELIKIVVAFNPETTTCRVVRMAEPELGWRIEDLETLYDYMSKHGWMVCRLDAARSENVIQRRNIYPGLQTYEGYLKYLKSGGDNSPAYLCFGRGFPPIAGSVEIIIPPAWPQDARAEATFIETPENCAAVDLAFMGKDTAQMAVGRWGLASGYRDSSGRFHTFKDRINIANDRPRHVLQIDQILPLAKHDNTVQMAEEILGRCKTLGIKPGWVAVDQTGYGFGVHGHLVKVWGDVLGVAWNEKSTERKIVAEDSEGADKQCDGVMSEMWWAFRRWLDPTCRAILINPIIPPQPIHTQLTTRRYDPGSAHGIKVEKKEQYMARNGGVSSDEADACLMLLHLVRRRSDVIPGLVEEDGSTQEKGSGKEGIDWKSVKDMQEVEVSDSINEDGKDEA